LSGFIKEFALLTKMAMAARSASRELALLDENQKNSILTSIADRLAENSSVVIDANQEDVKEARAAKMPEHMIDRLVLNEERLEMIINDLRRVSTL